MKITSAELSVMEVLWDDAPLAAAEVAARLAPKGWSVTTVKTLLSRLAEKGAVGTARDGRRYLYTPLTERAAHRRHAVGALSARLFGGKAAPMVAHLADAKGLSAQDLDELEALVQRLREDGETA